MSILPPLLVMASAPAESGGSLPALGRRGRRLLDRLLLDGPDLAWRRVTGRSHLPPLSLRRWVGVARRFEEVGEWFAAELLQRGLLAPRARLLDLGCGCGRIALALTRHPEIAALDLLYQGIDVHRPSILWCRRHITPGHPGYRFLHADLRHPLYNPAGAVPPTLYRLPFAEGSFDLVLAASLFSHLPEGELVHDLAQVRRRLAPDGRLYATFFLHDTPPEAPTGRHGLEFPHRRGPAALHSAASPTAAVSYSLPWLEETLAACGLELAEPIGWGEQDHLVLRHRYPVTDHLDRGTP